MAKKKETNKPNNTAENKMARAARAEKRAAKFAARREAGKTYSYEPNPFEEGTDDWYDEQYRRSKKNISHKLPIQKDDSRARKLQNKLEEKDKAFRATILNKKNAKREKKEVVGE